jgi:hypothetical protein
MSRILQVPKRTRFQTKSVSSFLFFPLGHVFICSAMHVGVLDQETSSDQDHNYKSGYSDQ